MKRFLKIFVPIILSLSIICGIGWYLFFYDTELTKDMLLSCAMYFESKDNNSLANWFYDRAIEQSSDPDAIAISMANRYIEKGNYTSAEVTLNKAISEGGGAEVYVALSNAYVKQNKLLDALNLLDNISDPALKKQLDSMRPAAPIPSHQPGDYNTYISVAFDGQGNAVYVNKTGHYPSINSDRYSEPIATVEGTNQFHTVAVSQNGLVSTLAPFQYTIGGVIEKVTFKDPAIEGAVRELLGLPLDYAIMTNDMWKIKSFTIPSEAIDYSDLQEMTSLETLNITSGASNQMHNISKTKTLTNLKINKTILSDEDLESIGQLTSLESLTLDTCSLTTISPLSGLTALRYLNLNVNSLRDISALNSMTELEELYIHENALCDLAPISSCTKLQILDLSYNQDIISLEPLSGLTLLNKLNISNCKVTNISYLRALSNLRDFDASHNQITGLDGLQDCVNLTNLYLTQNSINDLTPLHNLVNIEFLDFSQNQVTKLPVWAPDCKLITIEGSKNLISDLTPLAGLQNINNILMNDNPAISRLEMLLDCPNLIEVQVYNTKVSKEEAEKLSDPEENHHAIIVHYTFAEAAPIE